MHLTCHKKEINLGSISSHSLKSNFPPLISPTLRILSIQNYCLTITSTSITTVIWDDQRSACCTCISLICTSAQTHILGNIGLQNYILILLLSVLITWSLQVNSNFTFHEVVFHFDDNAFNNINCQNKNRKSKFYPSMIDILDSVWERELSGIYSQMVIAEKLL